MAWSMRVVLIFWQSIPIGAILAAAILLNEKA
jgi:hypothetical protein